METIQGFSLLELLIVIAILAILVLLTIGNFYGIQKRAYDTRALSCANSLNRAVGIYKIDFPFSPVVPDLDTIYGTPAVDQAYGTGVCEGLTLASAPQPQGYQFTVRHPQGHKLFTIREESIRGE